jgi:hypothetical protein
MDSLHDFGENQPGEKPEDIDYAVDAPPVISGDERRMQVRAYNYWVSKLAGRTYPSIEDVDPASIGDFGPHSVLLDFTQGSENPAIVYLGGALRHECGFDQDPETVSEVPARSLLSRLTDHYLQIIANKAPVGFEAEFVNTRGTETMYRGILMPLSSDGDTIDFIYGVINWKEAVSGGQAEALASEIAEAMANPMPRPTVPVWADGPSQAPSRIPASRPVMPVIRDEDRAETNNQAGEDDAIQAPADDAELADWLATARANADAMLRADTRSRAALYGALGAAYDFALRTDTDADDYQALLEDSGIAVQERAPMTPIVKLVFGTNYDKTRLTEFSSALSYAKRHDLPIGGMRPFLEQYPGGLKAIVAADRRERRPADKVLPSDTARETARGMVAQAVLSLSGDDEFVVLLARRLDPNHVAVIGIADDQAVLERAIRVVAR